MHSKTWTGTHQQTTRGTSTHGVITSFLRGMTEGFRRARQRRDLARLPDHLLRDIGLGRGDVEVEINKPFWRA